jgi:hypothetical protein
MLIKVASAAMIACGLLICSSKNIKKWGVYGRIDEDFLRVVEIFDIMG